jgi:hypothetical protein
MRAGFSFSYPSISLLLGQPLSIKKSYAGAIQVIRTQTFYNHFYFLGIYGRFARSLTFFPPLKNVTYVAGWQQCYEAF